MFVLNLFANGDHVCLAWRPVGSDPAAWQPIAGCRGFAIQRRLTRDGQTATSWLHNRIGFKEHEKEPVASEAWRWPIQRYMWWDYDVEPGDGVSYRVVPVLSGDVGLIEPKAGDTPWTASMTVGSDVGDGVSVWFNRGVIATQWVAAALQARSDEGTPKTTLLDAVATKGDPLREALGGHLKPALLGLLRDAPGDVYTALYELNDPEVVDAFKAMGARCHMILGNGAFKPPETDENQQVRAELRGTAIDLHDRIVSSPHFAHNKFIVFCDGAGNPARVWTGSTNLTVTGICTQVNNGILIDDADVAKDFHDAWKRMLDAGDGYGEDLVTGNSTASTCTVGKTKITSWHAATSNAQDMVFARSLVDASRDGILFLFFYPGEYASEPMKETLLQTVLEKMQKDGVYVRGVVNREITGLTDGTIKAPVNLVATGRTDTSHLPKSVLVPAAITADYGDWEKELRGASSVMVHSKVIVLDPFGDAPIVMTGSHNMGYKASHSNDDNLVVLEGNGALARAYAANIVAIYQEYRWRDYVASHREGGWKGLQDDDAWQAGHLTREAVDMLFWVPARLG